MKGYFAPCYTLEEAQEKLSLSKSELAHKIRTSEIEAVLYTKSRKMLVFGLNEDRTWKGLATCYYRGHFTAHIEYIERLLDGEKINIGKGYGRFLDSHGVSHWSTVNPYTASDSLLANWLITQTTSDSAVKLLATPCPIERETPAHKVRKFFVQLSETLTEAGHPIEALEKANSTPNASPERMLDFTTNSSFAPEDLRIPASEIQKALLLKNKSHLLTIVRPCSTQQFKRENELHTLISRIITDQPDFSAKEIWRLIETDFRNDESIYDTDNIIQNIDSSCIEWKSKKSIESTIKWSSFNPVVSRVRKRIVIPHK